MTPQSPFMVAAPIEMGRINALRQLLATMNRRPGEADPLNPLVPFGELKSLHFARFVILEDNTQDDITAAYRSPRRDLPTYLVFLGDVDGSADAFLTELAEQAGPGLRQVFSHCKDFDPQGNLIQWMKKHEHAPAAQYVNFLGRTVKQVLEERALRDALANYKDGNHNQLTGKSPREIWSALNSFAMAEIKAGRLTLTPTKPTPFSWWINNLLHMIGLPFVLLLLSPFLLLYAPFFLWQLRRREITDEEIVPPHNLNHLTKLAALEDFGLTNQFSAFGNVKPGLFRRVTVTFLVMALNYASRHIYNHGFLTRVRTIHFARWVFLDDKNRLLFASNYDGSLESYMDDFINKVAWGLNLVFSNGVGYPRTNWLIFDGAKDEQKFKYFIRRHQLPTEVWYNAVPGLTAIERTRNTKIREAIERQPASDADIQTWLDLI